MFNCSEAKLNNQASKIHSHHDARNIIKIITCTKCFELHNSSLNMPLSLMCAYHGMEYAQKSNGVSS